MSPEKGLVPRLLSLGKRANDWNGYGSLSSMGMGRKPDYRQGFRVRG